MILAQIFPWSIWDCLWLAPLALLLDLLFGDPRLPWQHPVCLIGKILNTAEKISRNFAAKGASGARQAAREKAAGFISLFLACAFVYIAVFLLEIIPYIGIIFAIYFAWAGLAMGCLLDTGKIVLARLESGNIEKAREGVAWLVSRDVSQLDFTLLRKTLADTLSENFTDAFLAPFFWLVLTGPAGLWLYKTVSTMDSQWGYLTPSWKNLGYAGAKGDDSLAYIPARLSPIALWLAHKLAVAKKSWRGRWPGFKRIARDAAGMPSPNSGWPMAACAWLCAGRMAGPSVYFGSVVQKGYIGPENAAPWDKKRLASLMRLMFWGAICGGALVWLPLMIISSILRQ